MKKRLFIGLDLPAQTRKDLVRLTHKLALNYRDFPWGKPEKYHVTLKFLGETGVDPQAIHEVIAAKVSDMTAFSVGWADIGLFVRLGTTVFIETEKNESLLRLYHKINNGLETLGFVRDSRVYHPHVTLGKVIRFRRAMPRFPALRLHIAPAEFDRVILYESTLTPGGSVYQQIDNIPLPKA